MSTTATQPTLERGKALVLVGPQGCGKTTLARQIAQGWSCVAETPVSVLANDRETLNVLNERPAVWIIDGFPQSLALQAWLKALIASPEVQMRGRNGQLMTFPTPQFIFCTGDADSMAAIADRRFTVINVNSQGWSQ